MGKEKRPVENEKQMFRKKALGQRSAFTADEVKERSARIVETLMNLEQFGISRTVLCYNDFKNEVMTERFIQGCLQQGKRVAVPVISGEGRCVKKMLAAEIYSVEELEPGFYGILEPRKDVLREIAPLEIDLVVVPGVAFDGAKNRMGYGAGYYDRFMKELRKDCLKVGVAFELQVYDRIPVEEHDVPLDMIITENRIIY